MYECELVLGPVDDLQSVQSRLNICGFKLKYPAPGLELTAVARHALHDTILTRLTYLVKMLQRSGVNVINCKISKVVFEGSFDAVLDYDAALSM